jgi:hypothetical protein
MARLTETDRAALRELTERGFVQSAAERSPAVVAQTLDARERYCRWATAAAKFFKGAKPVRFVGDSWRL